MLGLLQSLVIVIWESSLLVNDHNGPGFAHVLLTRLMTLYQLSILMRLVK